MKTIKNIFDYHKIIFHYSASFDEDSFVSLSIATHFAALQLECQQNPDFPHCFLHQEKNYINWVIYLL